MDDRHTTEQDGMGGRSGVAVTRLAALLVRRHSANRCRRRITTIIIGKQVTENRSGRQAYDTEIVVPRGSGRRRA